MKLLFLMNNVEVIGGGDYSIFKFAEYLARLDHKVTVIANSKNEFLNGHKLPQNLQVKYRRTFSLKIKGYRFIQRLWEHIFDNIFLLKSSMEKFDYLIGYQKNSSIHVAKRGIKFNIPTVNFIFEAPSKNKKQHKEWVKVFSNPKTRKAWNEFKKSIIKSDIVLANSNQSKRETEEWINRPIDGFVYPGIDLDPADKIKDVKEENQIIYIGRLYGVKNINEIIKALSKIKDAPKFVICGDGEEKENLMRLANKLGTKCEFMGKITDHEKWVLIKKSKFMVFPSSFEGFGMSPMEALYCERPCIVSDLPIFKEVYHDKVEYFKEHNMIELTRLIKKLVDNPDYCRKRGINGKKYVKDTFGWLRSAKKIEGILENYVRK